MHPFEHHPTVDSSPISPKVKLRLEAYLKALHVPFETRTSLVTQITSTLASEHRKGDAELLERAMALLQQQISTQLDPLEAAYPFGKQRCHQVRSWSTPSIHRDHMSPHDGGPKVFTRLRLLFSPERLWHSH